MTPFWNGFFEHLNRCGRNGSIFMVAIFSLFGIALCGVILSHEGVVIPIKPLVALFGATGAVLLASLLRRGDGTCGRGRIPRLSEDELRVARERLKGEGRRNSGS